MVRKILIVAMAFVLIGCITANTKIKVTDPDTGNSITVTGDGVVLDINKIEKDGVTIEVLDGDMKASGRKENE